MTDPDWASAARLYDTFLDGKNGWPTDVDAAKAVQELVPNVGLIAGNNRRFLQRATRYLAGNAGVRQFLDIGVGMPAEPNVHQIAQGIAPESRVVYVDNDPNVVAHARALLKDSTAEGAVAFLEADLRDPQTILESRQVRDTLDFDHPVALLLVSVMLFVADEDNPYSIVSQLVDALPSGSYLALSQGTYDHAPEVVNTLVRVWGEFGIFTQPRTHQQIARFFSDTGMELVDPGLVATSDWRPDPGEPPFPVADSCLWAGVGRKP